MDKYKKWNIFFRRFVSKYTKLWIIAVFLQVAFYLMGVARPYFYKVVIDSLIEKDFHLLKIGVIGYSLIQLLSLTFLLLQRFTRYKLDLKVMKDINLAMFRKSLTTDYCTILKNPTGQLMQRFSDDVFKVLSLGTQVPADLIGRVVFFIGILLVMFHLSVWLMLVSLGFLVVYFIGYRKYSKVIPNISQQRQDAYSYYLKELEEGLNLGYESRIHNAWKNLLERFRDAIDFYIRKEFRFMMVNAIYQGIMTNGVYLFFVVSILITGVKLVTTGNVTVGTLVAFISYSGYLYDFVSFLTTFNIIVEPAMISLDRINEILGWREKFAVEVPSEAKLNHKIAVSIKDLRFRIENKEIFDGLSFEIERGKFASIFGESGRGKTTLINLFMKVYEPPKSSIFIFGRDLAEIPIEEIYGIFSVVEQEPKFFTGTVEENLLLHSGVTLEDVEKVAKNLGLGEFLMKISTKKRGAKLADLSGGERKRLGLIRGLIKPRPIVLLDEPTAFLDRETSVRILEGMRKLLEGRTVIMFTHDPLVRGYSDQIINI